jgi:hypothetical protein
MHARIAFIELGHGGGARYHPLDHIVLLAGALDDQAIPDRPLAVNEGARVRSALAHADRLARP